MKKVSTIIITFNEEHNIDRCLASVVDVSDEIIVVDSYSTDRTREICESYQVSFYQHPFESYVKQKAYALTLAKYDHVLNIDADEVLSAELRESILKTKADWKYDGYRMNRLNNYCGKWIRHGAWYPDRTLRLFDRNKVTWGGRDPHEKVILVAGAKRGRLKGNLLHYTVRTIEEHDAQIEHFSARRAKVLFHEGKKPNLYSLLIKPIGKFIINYFLKLGFLDGYYGFLIAYKSAIGYRKRYIKLRELYASHRK